MSIGGSLPFAAHVAIGSLVLIALIPFIRIGPTWSSDEGAVRLQVDFIATNNSWSGIRPFADIDPEEVISPIEASSIVGDRYFPYTKRPAYPLLLAGLQSQFGREVVVLPSLVGTLLAAVVGAQLVGLLGIAIRRTTFWVLALGSPLFFYGYTVTAHTLAAALSAWTVFALLKASRGARFSPLFLGSALASIFAAVLLRPEALAFGASLSIAAFVLRPSAGRRSIRIGSVGVAAAAVSAHLLSRWWAVRIAGVDPVSEGEGILDAVRFIRGAVSNTFLLGFGEPLSIAVVVAITGGCALLALTAQREPLNRRLQWVFAGVSVAGSVFLVFAAPILISGLFAAMPILVAGLVVFRGQDVDRRVAGLIVASSVAFLVAVFVTQDSYGGGVQWGGRYLMLAVPILVPVALVSLRQLVVAAPSVRSLVVVVLAIASIAMTYDSAVVLRTGHDNSRNLNVRVVELAGNLESYEGRRPVIVSTITHLGRHVWRTVEDIDYFLVPEADFDEYMRRLAGEDLSGFGLVGSMDDERERLLESVGFRRVSGYEPPYAVFERMDG